MAFVLKINARAAAEARAALRELHSQLDDLHQSVCRSKQIIDEARRAMRAADLVFRLEQER